MPDREKVIKHIVDCVNDVDGLTNVQWVLAELDILKDALVLLKAQEPRVMTLEELIAWQKKPIIERDPIYVEYREGKGFGAPHWAQDNFGFNVVSCSDNYRSGVYGMLIRCWTSRPDKKTMEETPWN